MNDKVLVRLDTINDAMMAIRKLRKLTGDNEFDYVYELLEKVLNGIDE